MDINCPQIQVIYGSGDHINTDYSMNDFLWRNGAVLYYSDQEGAKLFNRKTLETHNVLPVFMGKETVTDISKYMTRAIDFVFGINNIIILTPFFNKSKKLTDLCVSASVKAATNLGLTLVQRYLIICTPFQEQTTAQYPTTGTYPVNVKHYLAHSTTHNIHQLPLNDNGTYIQRLLSETYDLEPTIDVDILCSTRYPT